MKELSICPATLAPGFTTYSPVAAKTLFEGKQISPYLDFSFEDDENKQEIVQNIGRVSVSGVQEKFSGVLDGNCIRLARSDEQGTYILKPAPLDYSLSTRKQMPANEHLTMQIASQIYGIQTALNGICFCSDGQPVYITRRFDVNEDGSKTLQEDFAVLMGMTEQADGSSFKYEGCYADIAEKIRQYVAAWPVAMEQFFRLVVFNYIYGNGDAHLKNFSLQKKEIDYTLAPAYDLLNTSIHLDGEDFALNGGLAPSLEKSDVYDRTGHPCRLDFVRFGLLIGLKEKRIQVILHPFMDISSGVLSLIERSFLNDKMKRNYRRIIEERHQRFIRESE